MGRSTEHRRPREAVITFTPGTTPAEGRIAHAAAAVPPQALLLISIVSIQLGAAVAVELFPVLGPVGTTFLRLGFSAVLLLAAARSSISRSARLHARPLLAYGTLLAVMNLSFYGAIERIPLGIAVAVEFIGPLGLAAATSHRRLDFAWIGLGFVGIVLLAPEIGTSLDPLGVALAGVAGLCWAAFTVMTRRIGRALPANSGLALGTAIATIVVLPVQLAVGDLSRLDPGLLLATLAVAILSTALPLSLEFEALKRMTARTYGILVTLEPVAAAVIGAILLGQALGAAGVAAVACVTVAALGVTITDRRHRLPSPPVL